MTSDNLEKNLPSRQRPGAGSAGSLRMVVTMGGIGLVCGVLIVLTFQMTYPVIEKNKIAALERAVFEVVPGAERRVTFHLVDGALERTESKDAAAVTFYACYDGDDRLVGVALEASGQGFQDAIRLIYGYSPYKKTIIGMKVLESKETPGLGDKIDKDPRFRSNFDSLAVTLDTAGSTITRPIVLVKHGEKTGAWQIEAITGATISSRAVAKILETSTAAAAPVIARNLSVLEGGAK